MCEPVFRVLWLRQTLNLFFFFSSAGKKTAINWLNRAKAKAQELRQGNAASEPGSSSADLPAEGYYTFVALQNMLSEKIYLILTLC
jgi:hypothetical protein